MRQCSKQSGLVARASLVLMVLASTLLSGCSSFTPPQVVPFSTITNAAKNGESSEQIIGAMNSSKTIYAMRGSDFAKLAERGFPDPVLDELQQRFFSQVEFLTRLWYSHGPTGGPSSTFPQPLDLANLDRGGNGMAPTTNVGRVTHGTRPQGVPEWVPPFPAVNGPVISASSVVEMTNSGKPAQEIAEAVLKSRIDTIYAGRPNTVALTRTAALTGSMFARFAEQGVTFEVLDALQATNIAQHVEWSRNTGSKAAGGFR